MDVQAVLEQLMDERKKVLSASLFSLLLESYHIHLIQDSSLLGANMLHVGG